MARENGKNNMRTPEEKEQIILRWRKYKTGKVVFCKSREIEMSVFRRWIKKYDEKSLEGLISKTGKSKNILKTIKDYVYYYNHERPAYSLNYKTPYQYSTDME